MSESDLHKKAFGLAVRKYRERLGVSQEELARRAGIHRTYVGDVERGERNISVVNMMRLARALNTDLSKLVREMERHLGH